MEELTTDYGKSLSGEGELTGLFFTSEESAVVREAAARLIPGPDDDPAEAQPGAREADVVTYIDRLLGAFSAEPPLIYAAPPGDGGFLPLSPAQRVGWRLRTDALRRAYREGVALLDRLAGGSFTDLPPPARDAVLTCPEAEKFRDLLFDHAIQAMHADPVYSGTGPGAPGPSQVRDLGFPGGGRSVPRGGPTAALAGHFEDAVRQLVAGVFDE